MNDKICTYCGRTGHRASNCPVRARRGSYFEAEPWRVWPDGTVQAVEDGAPYSHMSDDYAVVCAGSEEEAKRHA